MFWWPPIKSIVETKAFKSKTRQQKTRPRSAHLETFKIIIFFRLLFYSITPSAKNKQSKMEGTWQNEPQLSSSFNDYDYPNKQKKFQNGPCVSTSSEEKTGQLKKVLLALLKGARARAPVFKQRLNPSTPSSSSFYTIVREESPFACTDHQKNSISLYILVGVHIYLCFVTWGFPAG